MKKISTLLFFVIAFFSFSTAFAQSLVEDFNYPAATLLTAASPGGPGFVSISGGGTNNLTVTSPGLTYAGSTSSGVGNAVSMTTNGDDETKVFAPTINSGNAYGSFLVNVSTAQAGGDYFFSLYDAGGYKARVFIKSTTGGFLFGIAKNSTTATYETTVRTFGSTYLLVLKYTFNTVSTADDVVSLYVNPALGGTEPGIATIAPTSSGGAGDATTIDRIALRQGAVGTASAQVIDAIRVGATWASVTPAATPTISSISPTSANAGSPDIILTVTGTNFNSGSVVTWNGSSRTTTFVSATQLTAIIPATDLGAASTATVGVSTGSVTSGNTQNFTINAIVSASFSLTAGLTDFGNVCINTTVGPNSFTFDGNNLDGSSSSTITIAALAGFSYSLTAGGTYTSTLIFTYTGSSFTGTVIYVKFNPTAVQSYNGNILISGGGVSNYPVSVSGIGINSTPGVTTGSSSNVTSTGGTISGTISASGCTAVSAYGFEYSTSTGFADGTGTPVSANNLNSGNFSATLTGLAPNTRYYYKAYATNAAGTTYGLQQAFTNTASPVLLSAQPGLSFTETFADIANWSNFFISGTGANHFSGLSATVTAPATGLPDPTKITAATNSFQGAAFGASGGVQKGTDQVPPTQSIVLLSTGGAGLDNTSSAAIDFYMDFTGVNAGTLSFDWASVNNQTGDRNGSLKVYASTDGISWTNLNFADVLNFTNNAPTSGSKNNIALPASFNNSATARLRFYYYNSAGGTTGSRPKISIDNLTITALATTPCIAPTAAATSLSFGTVTDVSVQGSFTAASPATDQYLVIASANSTLTTNPVNGQIYNLGDNVGDGTVVAKGSSTSFTATGLSASTTYYFFMFPVNGICTGGPLYYTSTILTGQATTTAGLPSCIAPATQATALTFGTTTTNSIQGSFTATTADEYLVLQSTSSMFTGTVANGQAYTAGDVIGNARVVQRSNATNFTASNLLPNTPYYFYVFSAKSQACVNGPAYNTTSPLTGTQTTIPLPPCVTPTAQPSVLTFNASNTAIAGNYNSGTGADAYLIVISTSSTLSATPADNTTYNTGDNIGGGTVVGDIAGNSFLSNGLVPGTTYYFFVFAENKNCSGGPKYLTGSPLTGTMMTTSVTANSYYFGTLHSHSDYSDGNQDNPGYTPTDDYNYAISAQCMDYLGISEHNHFSSPDNPGNLLSTYHSGITEANTFSASHPNFLALYGMEWGVISNGGHVVVYGDGMDDLFGWETGAGPWGSTSNYDVFVPKSVYLGSTGLFKVVNDNVAKNTFATLAHPNLTDYNNIADPNAAYDATADNAITGTAVESGPASSTNTTYSNPGSPVFYLWYYQTLLSKGYHLGPTVDHDNHKTTFGKTTYSRTAIVAPALTKTEIIKAMRNMHFYATEDCDSKVDFSINTKMMGSIFTDRFAPVLSVQLTDVTTSTSGAVIRIMYGTPGSGVLPVKLDSVIGNTFTLTDNSLADHATGYYYADIINGSSRIITSPIWYTRNDNNGFVLPLKLVSFNAAKNNDQVKLTWTTNDEVNTKEFIIERSVDGRNFQKTGTVVAAGNSMSIVGYQFVDVTPNKGNNYYRLQIIDKDGKLAYSNVLKINFSSLYTLNVSPNPAKGQCIITVTNATELLNLQMVDMNGKLVKTQSLSAGSNKVDIAKFAAGLYMIKVIGKASLYTEKLIIE